MNWRSQSNKIITDIIKANPTANEKELRKLISKAYPFGERKYFPYKVWLSEVKECLRLWARLKQWENEKIFFDVKGVAK